MIPVRDLGSLGDDERRALLERGAALPDEVVRRAREIVDRVQREGDAALRDLTRTLDRVEFEEVPIGRPDVPEPLRRAIDATIANVKAFHRHGLPENFEYPASPGTRFGAYAVPYGRAGIYVPGGKAVYPSTVVMAAVPARLAGVGELVLTTPNPQPAVLYAASRCGVSRVFRVGGAQAVAALAFGTATVPRADIIVGPGNAYVTAAKKLLSDRVAIDFIAGPTEIMVLWDGSGRADFVAAELAAQAEHDVDAAAILVTPSAAGAAAVAAALDALVPMLERSKIVAVALRTHGRLFTCRTPEEALDFANAYAPEHLALMGPAFEAFLSSVRTAGAVSAGLYASVALADYGSGPNHILPTMGHARRSSALSARTFLRWVPYQRISSEGIRALASAAIELARAEGLTAHARAIELRVS